MIYPQIKDNFEVLTARSAAKSLSVNNCREDRARIWGRFGLAD